MKLTNEVSLKALRECINGDEENVPGFYRKGPELIDFFNPLGFEDTYNNFPSRKAYTDERLKILNDQEEIDKVIYKLLDPLLYIGYEELQDHVAAYLNKFFILGENFELYKNNRHYKIRYIVEDQVDIDTIKIDNEYIAKQIDKCDMKLSMNDLDGALTTARSLVESILLHIIKYYEKEYKFNGDLYVLYKKVSKYLNLSIEKDDDSSLKKILSGLVSIMTGLSEIRNNSGDAHGHAKTYTIKPYHALFVVNSAKTTAIFLYSVFQNRQKVASSATNAKEA